MPEIHIEDADPTRPGRTFYVHAPDGSRVFCFGLDEAEMVATRLRRERREKMANDNQQTLF